MSSLALLEQMLTKGKAFGGPFSLWAAVFLLPPCIGNTSLVTTPAVCIQARLWAVAQVSQCSDVALTGKPSYPAGKVDIVGKCRYGWRAYYLWDREFWGRWRLRIHARYALMVRGGPMVPCPLRVRNICSYTRKSPLVSAWQRR